MNRPLTRDDKAWIFRRATGSFERRYAAEIARGMTDQQIADALERILGMWGGSYGPGDPDVMYKGSGLKIWGGWETVRERDKPLFQDAATVAMAREVYCIRNPEAQQLALF